MEELGLAIGIAIILFFGCAGMTYANYWMYRRSEENLSMTRRLRDEVINGVVNRWVDDSCCSPATVPQQSVT